MRRRWTATRLPVNILKTGRPLMPPHTTIFHRTLQSGLRAALLTGLWLATPPSASACWPCEYTPQKQAQFRADARSSGARGCEFLWKDTRSGLPDAGTLSAQCPGGQEIQEEVNHALPPLRDSLAAVLLQHARRELLDSFSPVDEGLLQEHLQAAVGLVMAAHESPASSSEEQRALHAFNQGDPALAARYWWRQERRHLAATEPRLGDAADAARKQAALLTFTNPGEALACLQRATEYEPESPQNWHLLGDAQLHKGTPALALPSYRKTQMLLKQQGLAEPDNLRLKRVRVVNHLWVGDLLTLEGRLDEAQADYEAAVDLGRTLTALDASHIVWQCELAVGLERIGDTQKAKGQLADALLSQQASLDIRNRICNAKSADLQCLRDLLVSHQRIGVVYQAQGDLRAAISRYQQRLPLAKALADRDPGNGQWQGDLASSYISIGDVQENLGEYAAALENYTAARTLYEQLVAGDASNTHWQRELSLSHNWVGDAQEALGQAEAALASFEASREIRRALVARDPANTDWQRALSVSHNRVGDWLKAQRQYEAAQASYVAGLRIRQALLAKEPSNSQWLTDVAASHERLGDAQHDQGQNAAAWASYEASLKLRMTLAESPAKNGEWLANQLPIYSRLIHLACEVGTGSQREAARGLAEQALALVAKLESGGSLSADQQKRAAKLRRFKAWSEGKEPACE